MFIFILCDIFFVDGREVIVKVSFYDIVCGNVIFINYSFIFFDRGIEVGDEWIKESC